MDVGNRSEIFKKNCGHFLWGLTPQKAHTENTKCTLQSLLIPRVLKSSILWKKSSSNLLRGELCWQCPKGTANMLWSAWARNAHQMRSRLMQGTNDPEDVARQWPLITSRWSLFLHYLSCKAGVGAPPGSRFLAYMSEKKNFERSPNPSYEFF